MGQQHPGRVMQCHRCPTCRVAFIPFLVAGDPDIQTTSLAIKRLDEIGADVIEVGVPYSVRACAAALHTITYRR